MIAGRRLDMETMPRDHPAQRPNPESAADSRRSKSDLCVVAGVADPMLTYGHE